jgi:hypothetical protein
MYLSKLGVITLVVTSFSAQGQVGLPSGAEARPMNGVTFIVNTLKEYQLVGIGDLPGCFEVHQFLKSLLQSRELVGRINDIVVDFGSPRSQAALDRYILGGEMVPRPVLRHVWDDTTRSLELIWDSPVYEEFFDTVRSLNLTLAAGEKIRVILADAPLNWDEIRTQNDLLPFLRGRSRSLAEKVNAVAAEGHRALVVSVAPEQFRIDSGENARTLIEKAHPGKFFAILAQGRFGNGEVYKEIERTESSWEKNSASAVRDTRLGAVKVSPEANAPRLEDAVDAILYVGPSESLTKIYPWAFIFQDDDYWNELNRRSRIVNGKPFSLANVGFDLRSAPSYAVMPFTFDQTSRPAIRELASHHVPTGAKVMDLTDFILESLERYPVVALGDDHARLEFYELLAKLLHDPRIPEKVNDIVVEFGDPFYQAVMDSYIVEGQAVSRDQRKGAWEYTAMGWYASDSPVYERFFDTVREVNLGLPPKKRMRVILGDAVIDPAMFRKDPEGYLHDFRAYHETARDPREIALAESVLSVIVRGRRGLMICGDGHLRKPGRTGNSREFIEKKAPGKLLLIDLLYVDSDVPGGSVVVNGDDVRLSLGPRDLLTSVRIPPLIFRDHQYWQDINRMDRILRNGYVDLAGSMLSYRSRYYEKPLPPMLQGAADIQ